MRNFFISKRIIFTLMFFILLSALLILPAMAGWGVWLQRIAGSFTDGLAEKVFSGMLVTALMWQVLAFFIPLTLEVEIFTVVGGLAGFFYGRLYEIIWHTARSEFWKLVFISSVIIAAGSFYPFILDHFGYYVPSIQWLTSFGLTKGLGNLDLIYAQMSSWHILQAGFSHVSDPFLRINTILLLAFAWYIVEKKAWSLLLLLPVLLLFIQSPSPDLASLVFAMVVLHEVLTGNRNIHFLFAFSVFVFTIKPTMMWLPLFVALYFFNLKRVPQFLLGMAVFALYVFKNLWLFGYAFFPVPVGDLQLQWAPNAAVLQHSSEIALLKTYDMQYTYAEILKFSTWESVYRWFNLDSFKSYVHTAFVISVIFLCVLLLRRKQKMYTMLALAIILKTFLVLLFSAQYRFFMDVFFVLLVILGYEKVKIKPALTLFTAGASIILLFLAFPRVLQSQVPSFRLGHSMQGFTNSQGYRPAYYSLYHYHTFTLGNFRFNVPDYDFSFDTPQPSLSIHTLKTYQHIGVFPQLIGNSLAEGLVWKKLTPAEQKELSKIIKSIDK